MFRLGETMNKIPKGWNSVVVKRGIDPQDENLVLIGCSRLFNWETYSLLFQLCRGYNPEKKNSGKLPLNWRSVS